MLTQNHFCGFFFSFCKYSIFFKMPLQFFSIHKIFQENAFILRIYMHVVNVYCIVKSRCRIKKNILKISIKPYYPNCICSLPRVYFMFVINSLLFIYKHFTTPFYYSIKVSLNFIYMNTYKKRSLSVHVIHAIAPSPYLYLRGKPEFVKAQSLMYVCISFD